jgi:hypothetical protein
MSTFPHVRKELIFHTTIQLFCLLLPRSVHCITDVNIEEKLLRLQTFGKVKQIMFLMPDFKKRRSWRNREKDKSIKMKELHYKLTVRYGINRINFQRVEHVIIHQQESKCSCVGPKQGHNDELTSAKILLGYLYSLSSDKGDGARVVLGFNSIANDFKALSSLRFSTKFLNLTQKMLQLGFIQTKSKIGRVLN